MNIVTIAGRTTRDVEIRTTANGNILAKFTLAVDGYRKEDPADFFDCVVFGKLAEAMETCHISRGTKLIVSGRGKQGSYEGKNGKVKTFEVIANFWEFAESKNSGLRPPQSEEVAEQTNFIDVPKEFEIEEGELPFV